MSNVTIAIDGRRFTVACDPGQEAHITGLAAMIDRKLHEIGAAGTHSDARMLLFAALHLADELKERESAGAAPDPADPRLDAIAARLENLASHLEGEASAA